MKNMIQNLKGFRDFLPDEARKRAWLRNKLAQICEGWGYSPIETPTLEPLEIFSGAIGEDEKMFFKFKDQGARDVALRYDQTVPTCRYVGQNFNNLTFPFKRYQIQTTFRSEKPQKGRYREFIQCDADIYGVKTPDADAETIALSLDIYRQLGFKNVLVRINSRTLLKNIPYKAIVSIDKIKKIDEEGVLKEMESRNISLDQAKSYLSEVKNLKPNSEIETIFNYLKNYGFPESWYTFDPTIARSFSYSMGPIWEVEISGESSLSVLGGERYDGLLSKLTGMDLGGTGFGLGFDRTLEALELNNLIPNLGTITKVLVTVFSPDLFNDSLKLSLKLRQMGINCELYPDPQAKLDKQLKYADKKGIPFAVILGPEEVASDTVTVKNMKTQTQKKVFSNSMTSLLNS